MKLLGYPFQAFFQPGEMEDYFGKKSSIRKRVAWAHVALTFIGLTECSKVT
jgi:hypothetical protein